MSQELFDNLGRLITMFLIGAVTVGLVMFLWLLIKMIAEITKEIK